MSPICNLAFFFPLTVYGAAWIIYLVYDAVVFCLTASQSLRLGLSNPRTLWRVLLLDGTFFYFSPIRVVI